MIVAATEPLPEVEPASRHIARLDEAFQVVGTILETYIGHGGRRTTQLSPPADPPAALDVLVAIFGLTAFERDLILLAAGAELSATIADLCSLAQKDPGKPFMTVGLALAAQPWALSGALAPGAALAPDGPLRHGGLIEFDPDSTGGPMLARLVVPEAVIRFLMGAPILDPRLEPLLERVPTPQILPPTQFRLAEQIATACQAKDRPAVVHLVGPGDRTATDIVAAAASLLRCDLYRLARALVPQDQEALARFVRLWNRDRLLVGGGLMIALGDDAQAPGGDAALARLIGDVGGILVLVGDHAGGVADRSLRPVLHLDQPAPDPFETRASWRNVLGDHPRVAEMAFQFHIPLDTLAAVAAAAKREAGDAGDDAVMDRLWELCRVQGRQKLTGLAQRLTTTATIDDLILDDPLKDILRQVVAHHVNRAAVLLDGGFGARGMREAGLSILLAGPSGVGKTMAAEVLANALSLDLFRIDLSQVVNKYIGETEKNLRRLFDAADEGGAILLFDEADALFGKRSEVKDSHDRHANIEVGYLLQRIENYRGIAILTTNMPDAIDQAFLRRLAYILHIPFPGRTQRAAIWARAFPGETETTGLDTALLAQLAITGGQIGSIARNAAMQARNAKAPVDMAIVAAAARAEYAKLDRVPTTSELAGWP